MAEVDSMLRREFVKSMGAAGAAMLMAGEVRAAAERPVGVALLGAAHMHTPMFLQMLAPRDDVKVVGVWDREPARAEKHARTCEAKVAKTPAEALSDPAVKCVLVLSETSLHAELAVAAAKAGKHVFVEKPLGVGARDAFEIADAVEKAGVLFTTGYHLRTNPKLLFVKENLEQGKLGRIVRVECSFCNDTLLQDELDPDLKWITQRQWGSLGGFADTGTHALDMLMWLLGDVEAVSAEIRAVTNRYPGCDETGQGLVRFKNGVVGTISAGWIEPENPVSLLVCGTEGHAAMFNDRLHLRSKQVPGADGARPWGKLPPGPDHPVLQFVSAVAGQKDLPLVTVREAAKRVQAMEALYESAKQRKWVSVG
jgi:predicted dehydrogenase